MKCACIALVTGCILGLPLLGSAASAQVTGPHEHDHPDVVIEGPGSWPTRRTTWADSTRAARSGGVSTTPDNQILVELALEDTAAANLFDLNGRTLVFTPDGYGGYSRSVRSGAWDDDIGQAVPDGAEVQLQSFTFDFAGRRWGSFFVSRHGLITFGEPLTYSYWDVDKRFDAMSEIAGKFVTTPTISPLYKPMLGGRSDRYGATQHVKHGSDRVVVTWSTTEPDYYVHGVPPEKPARFQLVLGADGSVRFSYADVFLGDGIVGLFSAQEPTKGALIASIPDPRSPELAGHLDLLEAAIYESSTGGLIVEWTTRGRIPAPPSGTWYSYRLHLDADEPYFDGRDEDLDFVWQVDLETDASRTRGGRRLPTADGNRIAMLVEDPAVFGITAGVRAGTAQFDNGRGVAGDRSFSEVLELPKARPLTDLSRPDRTASDRQSEVFHYRGVPDAESIACRVIGGLGDAFDLFVFHNEFRVDSQESATPWNGQRVDVKGIGVEHRNRSAPCGEGRLKGHWHQPVWMKSDHVTNHNRYHDERTRFDRGLLLFAHEFTHAWTAHLSYLRGSREPLFGQYCQCHWRTDLHTPAAFPWHHDDPGPRSLMGGRYWRDNGDGTFTPLDGYGGGGHSWLDLYAMGLAEADEVSDMFILRNLQPVNEDDRWGPHTGDQEIVSIEQVVAAEGPREPPAAAAQKTFNAAFVYLLEPGQTPDADLLRLHAEYRDKVIEHWAHVTGGRSEITTTVPGVANRSPVAVGMLADQVVRVDGAAVVDVEGAFRDPDGDPLTYDATSSAPAVASVAVSGSTVTVRAVAAGTATVTVTATDTSGSNTAAMLAFRVAVRVPATFTDDPILPGVTPIKAVHFTELRERIDLLRSAAGLEPFSWTDPILAAGVTPVRLSHLLELREALAAAYRASGRAAPAYTDAAPRSGTTPIRTVHLVELRATVVALQ